MQAKFYFNKSDSRYLNKNIELKYNNIPIQVLEPSSVVRPRLKVSSGLIGQGVNYLYVAELERYYFIKDWIMENGHITIECEVDVLMSWKNQLMNQNVIVKRNEKLYNLYQNDEETLTYQYTAKRTIPFPNRPFSMSNTQFILGIVGNTDD